MNFISGIISITLGVVFVATVFITQVKATNTTIGGYNGGSCMATTTNSSGYVFNNGTCVWTASETALWGLLTLVGIAGILYGVLNVFGIA